MSLIKIRNNSLSGSIVDNRVGLYINFCEDFDSSGMSFSHRHLDTKQNFHLTNEELLYISALTIVQCIATPEEIKELAEAMQKALDKTS